MTKKWRVAILGLGHWYSAYNLARALRGYPKAELAAVAWHNSEQLAAFTGEFQIPGYQDYGELLQKEDVDLVHLAPPVCEMADCAIMSARAGKHIVLGKPMAMTIAEADRMVEAIEESGVKCVAFQGTRRLRSAGLKMRVDAGEIGEIIVMHQTSRWSIAEDWYRSGKPGWFVDPLQTPGGAFIDEGIYWIDQLRWLAGSEVIQVEAKMANLVHREIEVEDWGMATLTFANGIIATMEAAWTINSPRKTGPSPKQNCVLRLEVIGTRGEIIEEGLRVPGRALLAAGAEGWVFEREAAELFGPPAPFPLDHLIECVESGLQSPASIQEARKSFRVALAAYQSARTGNPVHLQYSRTIVVVDYDPAWPEVFQQLRANVWPLVIDFALSIEHIGSTSVPGLAAKPIIDMSIVVPSEAEVQLAIVRLATIGYLHRGNLGIKGREAFDSPQGLPEHNLYVCPQGSPGLQNQLAVRHYLRSHPEAALAYGEMKKRLAREFPHDIDSYLDGKTDFLLDILRRAGFPSDWLDEIEAANRKIVDS